MGKMFMELLVLVGVIGTASGISGPSFSDEPAPAFTSPIWMEGIADSKPLSQITIPGTHNSMARYGNKVCQSWSLVSQLRAGIRFLDIRVRYRAGKLMVYNGLTYQRASFGKVLEDVADFLGNHPTEVVLMRLKIAPGGASIETTDMLVEKYFIRAESLKKNLLWNDLANRNPTLGEARGKIILLHDFPSYAPLGWRYSSLATDGDDRRVDTPSPGHMEERFRSVADHLEMFGTGTQNDIFLTYTSGTSFLISPKGIAKKINPKLHTFLRGKAAGWTPYNYGIIAMDFPSAPLLQTIIDYNM